jgi:hypothetical protein
MKVKTILLRGRPLVGQRPAPQTSSSHALCRGIRRYCAADFGGTTHLVNAEDILHVLETTLFEAQSYATGLEPATKRTRWDRNRTPCLPYE